MLIKLPINVTIQMQRGDLSNNNNDNDNNNDNKFIK